MKFAEYNTELAKERHNNQVVVRKRCIEELDTETVWKEW